MYFKIFFTKKQGRIKQFIRIYDFIIFTDNNKWLW